MPIIYVGFKNTAMELKLSVEVPIRSFITQCAVELIPEDRQTDRAKLGGVLIYIHFLWKRTKKNLSERVDY
jgi:hypothetical protein